MEASLGIDLNSTKQMSQYLAKVLADTYLLYTKTQNFHWNVIDPRFYSLHKLLEAQYKELAEALDDIAERIRMLNHKTPATLGSFLKLSSLKESYDDLSGDEMLLQLLQDHETVIRNIRTQIEQSTPLKDEGTIDLFIDRLRAHEKMAWMLRSHFESQVKIN